MCAFVRERMVLVTETASGDELQSSRLVFLGIHRQCMGLIILRFRKDRQSHGNRTLESIHQCEVDCNPS